MKSGSILLHQTPKVQKFYDLVVICLLDICNKSTTCYQYQVLFFILGIQPTSSVKFPLWSFCNNIRELQKNLCSSKSSLIHDTSLSFSPLSSIFQDLSGSLLSNCLRTPCSRILQIFWPSSVATYTNYKDHTLSNIWHIFTSFLCTQNSLWRKYFPALIPLWCRKTAYLPKSMDLWVMDPHKNRSTQKWVALSQRQ